MPPKHQTPYQLSKGLSYSQDIPPFLRAMKGLVPEEPGLDAKRPRLPTQFRDEDGDDDEEEDVPDDEKPTVIQISKKHLSAADVEKFSNGEELRPGNTGNNEQDDDESGRPQFRRPPTKDKKRKGGESEEKGNSATNKEDSNDKKRKKEKKVPLVHLNHLEEHDGEEEDKKSVSTEAKKQKRSTKASPTIRVPQYDGAIDDVEHDTRVTPRKSSAAVNTKKAESKTGPVWSGLVSYYDDDEGDNEEEINENSPRQASTTALPGLLHYSVADDSEEDVESEKQLQTAILRLPLAKPANGAVKRPSPSPEPPKIAFNRTAEVVSSRPTAIPSSFSVPQSENQSANSSLSGSPKNNFCGANLSSPLQTLPVPTEKMPVILSEMRALLKPQASESWVIPPEPQGNPDPDVQARIEKYHALRLQGLHYNENLQKNKKYRNPHIYSKLVEFVELDETGTNFSSDKYNPNGFDKNAYYDAIAIAQRKRAEDLAALQQSGNRSSVSFVTQQQPNRIGGGITMEPTPSIAASIAAAKAKAAEIAAASRAKRTSKWDQPSTDAKRVRGV